MKKVIFMMSMLFVASFAVSSQQVYEQDSIGRAFILEKMEQIVAILEDKKVSLSVVGCKYLEAAYWSLVRALEELDESLSFRDDEDEYAPDA